MNNKQPQNNDTIRISDLLHVILKHRKLIFMTSLAGLICGIILSIASYMRGEMSKQYVIKTSIAVTSQTQDGLFTTQTYNPNSTDIHLAEDMVDSVIFVIKSDRTLEAAVEKLELVGISTKDIYNNLVLTQYNKTQIIDISLYWRNAEEGVRILTAINEVAPRILMDILKIGGVAVVNDPSARYLIGGSVNASMWVLMTLVGMAAGIGVSVLILFLKPTLINCDDVQDVLGLELIGRIPKDRTYAYRARRPAGKAQVSDADGDAGAAFEKNGMDVKVIANINVFSKCASETLDNYSSAAHILKNRMERENMHLVYVTSAKENEGRTSVSANLALQLAQQEKKVLLIDMDVRTPSLGNLFLESVPYEHSMNAVFRGDAQIDDAIVALSGYLDLLPCVLENGEPLLNDAVMELIRQKASAYDFVLIDTSPVGQTAQIMSLNRIADAALFVIEYDNTTLKSVRDALTRLERSGINVVGCVVNGVRHQ